MNKKIVLLVSLIVLLGGILLWGCRSQEDISQYIPEEAPVSVEGDREFAAIRRKIDDACRRNDFQQLERYFELTKAEREVMKHESGKDPVADQLALLRTHAASIQSADWQIFTLTRNESVRILRMTTADDQPLSVTLVKRKKGYRITSVRLG